MDDIDVTDVVVKKVLENTPISMAEVISDWTFFILVVAVIAFTYLKPQIFYAVDFYSNCFRNKKGCCNSSSLLSPPRPFFYKVMSYLMDAMQCIAIISYIYNIRSPAPGGETDYYVSIESLYIILIIMKYLWIDVFFNHHHHMGALGLSMVMGFFIWILNLVLVILFGIRATANSIVWVSFAFQLIILFWTTGLFGWNCYIFKCFWCKLHRCVCHKRHLPLPLPQPHHHHHHHNPAYDATLTQQL